MGGMAGAEEFDAVVVGAGPNGLVASLTLAEAGQKVLLVEAGDVVGGGLRTEELTLPGFAHDVCATVVPLTLASPAFRSLELEKHGLRWRHPEVAAAHPLDDGPAGLVHHDLQRTIEGFGADGKRWDTVIGATARGGEPLVDSLLSPTHLPPQTPIRLARYGALGALPAGVLGKTAFRTTKARAAFAGMAAHSQLKFSQPITAGYGMLLAGLVHSVGWPLVEGGSQRLADSLAARLVARGGEVRTGVPVQSLADLPPARSVLFNVTPRQLDRIVGDRFPPRYRRRLHHFAYGPGVFKLDWALSGPVPWTDPAVGTAGTVHLGGTLEEIAFAEREVDQGRHPDRPYVLVVQSTGTDPTRAPEGKHVLWAYCHVPNGSTVDMTDQIEAQVERFAPGFRDLVIGRHAMNTADYERHNPNLIGGDINGGRADLSQFLRRPRYSLKPWRTPLPGVYICSSSTPPGGGVHGMGGYHAALDVLASA